MMLVLLLLIENQGAVVSREELLSEVWPGVIVSDDSLSRCISRLRKIFQGASTKVEIIETVRGRGYRLAHESRLEAGEKSYHVQTISGVPSTDSRALILGRAILILGVFFIVFSLGWMSSAYFGTPLIVYRDSDMIGSVGVILDSLFTGEISSSEMAFYTTGKLKSD